MVVGVNESIRHLRSLREILLIYAYIYTEEGQYLNRRNILESGVYVKSIGRMFLRLCALS